MKKEPIGITLHQLKIFWTVAQASSFTKASKILGLAQPSLSQQISKLEDEVGSLLFKRGRFTNEFNRGRSIFAKKIRNYAV